MQTKSTHIIRYWRQAVSFAMSCLFVVFLWFVKAVERRDLILTSISVLEKKNSDNAFFNWSQIHLWSESSFECKKTWLKRQLHFWERRIRRMHFLLDLRFWYSVEEAWTRLFPTQSWFICIPEKDCKNHTFIRRKSGPFFSFQYVWFWPLFHSFWSGQIEGQIKAHARVAPFWVFNDNCLQDIYRSCITLMQAFLVSLAKVLVVFAFVAKNSKNFLGFLSTILKNLASSCELFQD